MYQEEQFVFLVTDSYIYLLRFSVFIQQENPDTSAKYLELFVQTLTKPFTVIL